MKAILCTLAIFAIMVVNATADTITVTGELTDLTGPDTPFSLTTEYDPISVEGQFVTEIGDNDVSIGSFTTFNALDPFTMISSCGTDCEILYMIQRGPNGEVANNYYYGSGLSTSQPDFLGGWLTLAFDGKSYYSRILPQDIVFTQSKSTSSVPEPASLGMIAIGMIFFVRMLNGKRLPLAKENA